MTTKDSAAFEEWFLKHFANGKGTFFYSMRESFQFALEYARQEISPDISKNVISNDISTQPKALSFEELKWKLQREGKCSFPPEWLGIFKMFYDAGKASQVALRIEGLTFEEWFNDKYGKDWADEKLPQYQQLKECWQAALRSVEPAIIVLPQMKPIETGDMYQAGRNSVINEIKRLNAGAAFKEVEGE